ncbi:MAG: universal stress protein [Actinomycetes bacterium]
MNATVEPGAVVVGVDGSESGTRALLWAAREAEMRRAPLHLVHAWTSSLLHGSQRPAQGLAEPEARGTTLLDDARHQVAELTPRVRIETHLVTGEASTALVRSAQNASVLAVGSRGHGGFPGLLLGSTGVRVASHGSCPVAVVREDEDGPVLVGVDGSAEADDALRLAFEEAEMRGTSLTALHAYPYPVPIGVEVVIWGDDREVPEQAQALLAASVERWSEKFPHVPVQRMFVTATPAQALVQASADAGLVVVGCRGRGAFARTLLGSTSQTLVQHSHCPVLVVHRGAMP